MTQLTGNKRSMEEEHKNIVINNVEFCMLQFYKMQYESAQDRMQAQDRQIKKIKRELAHHQDVVHNQLATIRDQQFNIETIEIELGGERLHNNMLIAQRESAEHRLRNEEAAHLRTLAVLGDIMQQNPELREQYKDRIKANIQQNIRDNMNIMEAFLSPEEIDEEATEPDDTHYQFM